MRSGHPVKASSSDSRVVRFITLFEEGPEEPTGPMVCRIEGAARCSHCERLHQYQLGLAAGPNLLFDSWEDAAHQARAWLADGPIFLAHRAPEQEADATEQFFDNRAAAIDWLLEAVQQ